MSPGDPHLGTRKGPALVPPIVAVLTPAVALLPCLPIWLKEPADKVGVVAALTCSFIFLVLVLAGFMLAARLAGWNPKSLMSVFPQLLEGVGLRAQHHVLVRLEQLDVEVAVGLGRPVAGPIAVAVRRGGPVGRRPGIMV